MHKQTIVKFLLAAGAALLLTPASASAQTYICPGGPGPGEVQAGVQNGPGFNGVPVCARDPNNLDSGGGPNAEELAASYAPGPDPMARELEKAIAMEKLALEGQVATLKLESDPQYRRYVNGGWTYFQDAIAARPGELCTAFFTKRDSFVAVTGPDGETADAWLTFWGPDVPTPVDAKRVNVSLAQSGGNPPQMVSAFNSFNPANGMGGITLRVPTVDGLLDNMLDVHSFTVSLDGKTVSQIDWTGGHAARDQLRACIAKGARR